MNELNHLIGIKIVFDKNSTQPQRVFDAMSDLIQSVQSLHSCFLHSILSEYETELLLSDIKEGSLVSWLSPNIKDKNIELDKKNTISIFLDKCTQIVIEFLQGKETITNDSEIDNLENEIEQEAIKLEEFPNVFSLDKHRLLKGLSSIGKATNELHDEDTAYIELNSGSYSINKEFNFSDTEVKNLLSVKREENIFDVILIIKKADFLGNSMWDFVMPNKAVIPAKMLDHDWINKFRHRDVTILPGDRLKCKVKSIISYDKRGNVIEEKHEVLNVIQIIEWIAPENGGIFDE